MKKIPTLFERIYENHKVVGITENVHPGMEWVLDGEGVATVKYDGSCCAIIDGVFYKRYDVKKGKKPPKGAIPCCEPDPITGHWPHWVKVDRNNPADKWFVDAYENTAAWSNEGHALPDGTYEATGEHFQGDPYGMKNVPGQEDILVRHGWQIVDMDRSFDGIKNYLNEHAIEEIVFWRNGEPMCKIKRSDFGFEFPVKEKNND